MKLFNICNRLIEYSFYLLFFLVPLVFTSSTSELFELNKMWLTFGITIIIACSWLIKMVLQRRIVIQRTPLDIPILLFLLSQVISTIFSLDVHVSLWGYYSRFNGGLLSIISYISLYYAFVSNFSVKGNTTINNNKTGLPSEALAKEGPHQAITVVKRSLVISLISGLIVALWGLPSHFGYDPTCFLFRGTFDVSCWTDAFQPKVRIFSTLGQPDWLGAYLNILIPIAISFLLINVKSQAANSKQFQNSNSQKSKSFLKFKHWNLFEICNLRFVIFLLLTILFYVDLIYTDSRSNFFAFWISFGFFIFLYFFKEKIQFTKSIFKKIVDKNRPLLLLLAVFLIITFFIGTPIGQLEKFTFPQIKNSFIKQEVKPTTASDQTKPKEKIVITNSGDIRAVVWRGAIDVFRHYPIFGTGVETFAFAYYQFRPVEHNMLSEWDYLYNKAHNEYLNYLATTGAFGLGTYLAMIGSFLILSIRKLIFKSQITNNKQVTNSNNQNSKHLENLNLKNWNLFGTWNLELGILSLALITGYLSILISNFFGFSVVIINLYLFLIPAFVFILNGMINPQKFIGFSVKELGTKNSFRSKVRFLEWLLITRYLQWLLITIIILTSGFLILNLFNFWIADQTYSYGSNLSKVGQYQQAYFKLHEAISLRGDEPVFKDELSHNASILAMAFANEKESSVSSQLVAEALSLSDQLVTEYPHNVVFWKTRVRTLYALSQIDPSYLPLMLEAIKKAHELAPSDAKISYNMAIITQQNGDLSKAIEILQETIKLKPDYKDAYYALGLYYHEKAIDKSGRITDQETQKKAVETLKFILTNLQPEDAQTTQTLKAWGEI